MVTEHRMGDNTLRVRNSYLLVYKQGLDERTQHCTVHHDTENPTHVLGKVTVRLRIGNNKEN